MVAAISALANGSLTTAFVLASARRAPLGAERADSMRKLAREDRLLGLTRPQLEELLGPSDLAYGKGEKWSFAWRIGLRESGASMMFPYDEYLVVRLGDGEVEEAAVVNFD